jgi:uncharacterized membrane protein YkoI
MKVLSMLGVLAVTALVASPLAAQQDTTHGKMVSAVAKTNAGKANASKPKAAKKQKENLKALAKISKDSAKAVALSKVPAGSKVRSSELEREKGTVVYSFDIKVPKQSGVEEILVSAIDGSVVSQEHESPKKEKAEKKAEAKKQ